jgi:hypothetical protein
VNTVTQNRDELAAWLDSHLGQIVTAEVILEEVDGDDRYFAGDVLGAEGELQDNDGPPRGSYKIGDFAIVGAVGADHVHVSGRGARSVGVDFVHAELREGVILTVSARGEGVTS